MMNAETEKKIKRCTITSARIEKMDGSPGLVVMGGDSCPQGRGFESKHHKLDGHFSHIFDVKHVKFD